MNSPFVNVCAEFQYRRLQIPDWKSGRSAGELKTPLLAKERGWAEVVFVRRTLVCRTGTLLHPEKSSVRNGSVRRDGRGGRTGAAVR